jgi:hypothetical protein
MKIIIRPTVGTAPHSSAGLCGASLRASAPAATMSTAIEYFHRGYGHDFSTASAQEIAALTCLPVPQAGFDALTGEQSCAGV